MVDKMVEIRDEMVDEMINSLFIIGELALTGDQPIRAASVICSSPTSSLLVLLKSDFDFFIRNVHQQEKEENLRSRNDHYLILFIYLLIIRCLSHCEIFSSWSKTRLSNLGIFN